MQLARSVRHVSPIRRYRRQVAGIAVPFWSDLVAPEDYFEPTADWPLREPDPGRRQDGMFIVSANPELHEWSSPRKMESKLRAFRVVRPFELGRGHVPQGRVPADPVVERLDGLEETRRRLLSGGVVLVVNEFPLEAGEQAARPGHRQAGQWRLVMEQHPFISE